MREDWSLQLRGKGGIGEQRGGVSEYSGWGQ